MSHRACQIPVLPFFWGVSRKECLCTLSYEEEKRQIGIPLYYYKYKGLLFYVGSFKPGRRKPLPLITPGL